MVNGNQIRCWWPTFWILICRSRVGEFYLSVDSVKCNHMRPLRVSASLSLDHPVSCQHLAAINYRVWWIWQQLISCWVKLIVYWHWTAVHDTPPTLIMGNVGNQRLSVMMSGPVLVLTNHQCATLCLGSPKPQVSCPRAGPPPPSLIHMLNLIFWSLK